MSLYTQQKRFIKEKNQTNFSYQLFFFSTQYFVHKRCINYTTLNNTLNIDCNDGNLNYEQRKHVWKKKLYVSVPIT